MLSTWSPLKSGLHLNYWHTDDKSNIPLRISWVLRLTARAKDACEQNVILWMTKQRMRGMFLMVSLMAFQSRPCIFFLRLFYLSGGFLAQTCCPAVAAGGETCAGAHQPWPLCWFKKGSPAKLAAQTFPSHRNQPPLYFQPQTSLHHIYVYTENSFFLHHCCHFLTLLPKDYFPSFHSFPWFPCDSQSRDTLPSAPKCSWQLPSWPNQGWLIQHPSASSAFDL